MAQADVAKDEICAVIDRKSELDPLDTSGKSVKFSEGEIKFENVNFNYPAHPDKVVLNDVSLNFPGGKVCALAGFSGCGKSTIMQLVQRFYKLDEKNGGRIMYVILIVCVCVCVFKFPKVNLYLYPQN